MKAGEIREMSLDFNLRFQNATGQLENTGMLLKTRKDIARIETIIRENQLNQTDQK